MKEAPKMTKTKKNELIFPYSSWNLQLDTLKEKFLSADPFPHIVLENFLSPEAAERCRQDFPTLYSEAWINYTHVNQKKYGKSDRKTFPKFVGKTIDEFNSPSFVKFLSELTGIDDLIADEGLMGGGLHQSGRGGYLNVHADFTGHQHHPTWRRRINLLVYLNPDWNNEYGGHLELWDIEMKAWVQKITPVFNRAVIFRTDSNSFHGHPEPMTCPEDVSRKSLALYYYTEKDATFVARSTEYRARPGDGIQGVWIYMDKMVLRLYDKLKRTFQLSDNFASNLLGMMHHFRKKK